MKSIIKALYAATLRRFGFLNKVRFNTKIIAYHRANPNFFEGQMRYLKNGHTVVPLSKALENLKENQVVITFDDGYTVNKAVAYPVLKNLKLKATMFVTTEFADCNPFAWWDRIEAAGKEHSLQRLKKTVAPDMIDKVVQRMTDLDKLGEKPQRYDFLGWRELIEISDVFEIGSHTKTHSILTRINPEAAWQEIVDSKRILEQKTGVEITTFAYPNGDFNNQIASMVKEAGYLGAVAYQRGNNRSDDHRFRLCRRGIDYADNVDVFAAKVAGLL